MIGRVLRGLVLGVTAGVLIAAAFVLGMGSAFMLRPSVPIPEDVSAPTNFNIYGEVWRYVDSEYYGGRPEAEQITRGALVGLVASLEDPWAMVAPDDVTDPAWLEPRFVPSMGAWLEPVTAGARVLAIAPGGSADEAGLQAGDMIIDAEPIQEEEAAETEEQSAPSGEDDMADSAAAAALFQPIEDEEPIINVLESADEPMVVVLLRTGRAALQLELEPGSNTSPSASVERLEDGKVLVRPVRIDADGVAAIGEALTALADATAEGSADSALVLDLRDNPGGDRQTLADMAGLFLSGPLWVEDTRVGEAVTLEASAPSRNDSRYDAQDRLVVLVNGGTVGEAEMLAAALGEQADAVIVGEPSFGLATRTEVQTLKDGSLLRLSTASWQTQDGLTVVEDGLLPDWLVSGRDEQRDAGLASAAGEPVPPQETEAEEASAGGNDG